MLQTACRRGDRTGRFPVLASLSALTLALVLAFGCGSDEGTVEPLEDAASWPRVEAMLVQAHDLPQLQQRGFNPRSAGHQQSAMAFRQYLYDWQGLRVGTRLSGAADDPEPFGAGDLSWQEPWLARAAVDPRDFGGDFEALAEAQESARALHARFAGLARSDGGPPCSGLSPLSAGADIEVCMRLLVCAVGYRRVVLRVDPDAPRHVTVLPRQQDAGSGSRDVPPAFEPWVGLGFRDRDAFCEAAAPTPG